MFLSIFDKNTLIFWDIQTIIFKNLIGFIFIGLESKGNNLQ